jgi:hypothetical protein
VGKEDDINKLFVLRAAWDTFSAPCRYSLMVLHGVCFLCLLLSVRLNATSRPVVVAINKKDIAATGAQTPHTTQQSVPKSRGNSKIQSQQDSAGTPGASAVSWEGEESGVESHDNVEGVSGCRGSRELSGGGRRRGGAVSLAAMTLPALRELWQQRLPNAGARAYFYLFAFHVPSLPFCCIPAFCTLVTCILALFEPAVGLPTLSTI